MKKMIISLALVALMLVGTMVPAMASESNEAWNALLEKTMTSIEQLTVDSGELTVVGTAAIAATPDKATISLGAMYEDTSIDLAQVKTNQAIEAVINELKALGIPENKMATSNYSVYPTYDYSTATPVLRGYQVTNMLTVEVEDFSLISKVIDRAVASGANQVNNIGFDVSTRSEIYRQALASAIAAAQTKAEVMATAAGKKLGNLRSITEAEQGMSMYLNAYDSRDMKAAGAAQVLGGELNVTAQVTLVFEMK